MKRLQRILLTVLIVVLTTSCNEYYYFCTVNSYGVPAQQNTYYLVPLDSTMIANPFQYREYKHILESRLMSKGYVQTDSSSAALRIEWSYYFGDVYYAGTVSSSVTNNYGWSYNNATSQTNANASVYGTAQKNNVTNTTTARASAYGSSQTNTRSTGSNYNVSVSNTSNKAVYEYDLGCMIAAYDNRTKEPVWMVEAIDHGKKEKLRKFMKWAIVAACRQIGTDDSRIIKIQEHEMKEISKEISGGTTQK